ncbi:TetR/AcrR family transcriptional regulator [Aestuariivita sp.]|uniref:TetR/AcrR family transcriptional regulator n=1 Tax=Aestuariivita sp. TaxID=1872407 RepID=UPI002171964F|nr:TetR/AcrR family transcriptional regulator [Aestuariivita sp.]MCE8009784.1 TetR/AcrR family transcriptional regulator [Aestuariivita sp.]
MKQPDSQSTGRDRILDAAERVFADDGFSGAGMKAIAARAGVAQGLLHYHFTNKETLYAAVIERRSGIINADRLARLGAVDLTAANAVPQILRALMEPPLGPGGGGRAYARILAGLTVGDARDAELVRLHYDPTAAQFIDALQTALPHASRHAISWGYNLAIGTLVTAVSQSGRPERLANGDPGKTRPDAVVTTLVTYVEGGIRALIASEQQHR